MSTLIHYLKLKKEFSDFVDAVEAAMNHPSQLGVVSMAFAHGVEFSGTPFDIEKAKLAIDDDYETYKKLKMEDDNE